MLRAVLIVPVLLVSCNAFLWWGREDTTGTSDGRPVDNTCLAHADSGSCEFYSCFEQRLPCGRDWYMEKTGGYYCRRMMAKKSEFTPEGQQFLTDASRCMTQELKQYYTREYMNCHDLEHKAVESVSKCFMDNAFCSVFRENHGKFFDIYEFGDLFTRGSNKMWRLVSELGVGCTRQYIREQVADTHNDIAERVAETHQNIVDEVEQRARDSGISVSQLTESFNEAFQSMNGHLDNLREQGAGWHESINGAVDSMRDAIESFREDSEDQE